MASVEAQSATKPSPTTIKLYRCALKKLKFQRLLERRGTYLDGSGTLATAKHDGW